MRLALPDGTSEAVDSTPYRAYQTVAEQFGAGQNGPLLVVAQTPDAVAEADQLRTQVEVAAVLAEQSDVVAVAPVGVSDDGTVFAFQVIPHDGPASESTEQLVHTLRDLSPKRASWCATIATASGCPTPRRACGARTRS